MNNESLWKRFTSRRDFFLIAGPCVIESETLCMRVAESLLKTCSRLRLSLTFKASFDKANRTALASDRGPGMEEGLKILERVRQGLGVPVLTDVHTEAQARAAGEVVDVLQIPAFLCRQTDLIVAAARTGRIVNIKKGQFMAPTDMAPVVEKAKAGGARHVLLTERGTTFGYNNLVADMRSIPLMKKLGVPVVFDATHSVQLPGGAGDRSGGNREFAPVLARAALAAGASGVFIETHPNPPKALSDGATMIPLRQMGSLLAELSKLRKALN